MSHGYEAIAAIATIMTTILLLAGLWRFARWLPTRAGWFAFGSLIVLIALTLIADPLLTWLVAGTTDGKATSTQLALYMFTAYLGPAAAMLCLGVSIFWASIVVARPNNSFKPKPLRGSA